MKKPVKLYDCDDAPMADHEELMVALGLENDPYEENDDYLRDGGDFWIDCDRVRYDGITLPLNVLLRDDANYIVLQFAESDFPEHARIARLWAESDGEADCFKLAEKTWEAWNEIKSGIAYRGGSGYCYAIYEYKEEKDDERGTCGADNARTTA